MPAHESSGGNHRIDESLPAGEEYPLTREAGSQGAASLLDTAPCGFVSFSDDGVIRLANQTLLDMLELAEGDVVGGHIERIFNVGTRIFYQTHWFPLLRLHGHAEEIFLMLQSRAGQDVGVLSYTRRNPRGLYDCVLVPVPERAKYEDELLRARRAAEAATAELQQQKTELERANQQLEAQALELELQGEQLREQAERLEEMAHVADDANRAKSSFLAMMSHELRTPLNAISGYLQILELGIAGPITDAQRDILDRLDHSGRHLLSLINAVLDLSRIEAGRVDYHLTDIALQDVMAEVNPMVEPLFAAKSIEFLVDVGAELAVRADGEKLRQVLLNLLGNAEKFTPENGTVEVTAHATPGTGTVVIAVRDTGIGIPPGKVEAIFQPFVQVDSARTRTVQGSGLGLAISRDLARGMNGELTVSSEVGKGSTFMLTLPVASAQHRPDAENRARADMPDPD